MTDAGRTVEESCARLHAQGCTTTRHFGVTDVDRLPMTNICLIDADSLLYYEMGKPTLEEAVYGIDENQEHIGPV